MDPRYLHQTAAFLTQHGKEALLAPILAPYLGCQIRRVEGFDTDQLGTFTGEVPRLDNQIETARKKARIGIERSGLPIGIASEGAFVNDPFGGFMPWNIEVLVWLDTTAKFEVIGIAQGATLSMQKDIQTYEALLDFAAHAQFPAHHLVLRPATNSAASIHKGISDWDQLKHCFMACQQESPNGYVRVEHDHRAFCHPTRQAMIKNAAHDLIKKFQSTCPHCTTPGFTVTGHQAGLRCRSCGHPTHLPIAYTMRCAACQFAKETYSNEPFADPSRCDHCNP